MITMMSAKDMGGRHYVVTKHSVEDTDKVTYTCHEYYVVTYRPINPKTGKPWQSYHQVHGPATVSCSITGQYSWSWKHSGVFLVLAEALDAADAHAAKRKGGAK